MSDVNDGMAAVTKMLARALLDGEAHISSYQKETPFVGWHKRMTNNG